MFRKKVIPVLLIISLTLFSVQFKQVRAATYMLSNGGTIDIPPPSTSSYYPGHLNKLEWAWGAPVGSIGNGNIWVSKQFIERGFIFDPSTPDRVYYNPELYTINWSRYPTVDLFSVQDGGELMNWTTGAPFNGITSGVGYVISQNDLFAAAGSEFGGSTLYYGSPYYYNNVPIAKLAGGLYLVSKQFVQRGSIIDPTYTDSICYDTDLFAIDWSKYPTADFSILPIPPYNNITSDVGYVIPASDLEKVDSNIGDCDIYTSSPEIKLKNGIDLFAKEFVQKGFDVNSNTYAFDPAFLHIDWSKHRGIYLGYNPFELFGDQFSGVAYVVPDNEAIGTIANTGYAIKYRYYNPNEIPLNTNWIDRGNIYMHNSWGNIQGIGSLYGSTVYVLPAPGGYNGGSYGYIGPDGVLRMNGTIITETGGGGLGDFGMVLSIVAAFFTGGGSLISLFEAPGAVVEEVAGSLLDEAATGITAVGQQIMGYTSLSGLGPTVALETARGMNATVNRAVQDLVACAAGIMYWNGGGPGDPSKINGPSINNMSLDLLASECSSFLSSPSSTTGSAQSSALSWTCQNFDSCSVDNGVGAVATSTGTANVNPSQTTIYTLSCVNIAQQTKTYTTDVTVASATSTSPAPSISLTSPTTDHTVVQGGTLNISWTSQNAPAGSAVVLSLVNTQTGTNLGIVSRNQVVNGSTDWNLPPVGATVSCATCGGIQETVPVGTYKVVAKIYTPSDAWFGDTPQPDNSVQPTYIVSGESNTFTVTAVCSRTGSLTWGGGNCSNPSVNYQNVSPGLQQVTNSVTDYSGSITYQCNSSGGWDYVGETCTPPLPFCVFSANPSSVVPPQSSSLSWNCSHASACSVTTSTTSGVIKSGGANGSTNVSPRQTTSYTLSCSGPSGSASFQTTVRTKNFNIQEVAP